jgi:hypothetical protein
MENKIATDIDIGQQLRVGVVLGLSEPGLRAEITNVGQTRLLAPGLADLQLATVQRLGQRERFPRPYDWENLLPFLNNGEELLWIVRKEGGQFHPYLGLKTNRSHLNNPYDVRDRRRDFLALVNHFCRRSFPESRVAALRDQEIDGAYRRIHEMAHQSFALVTGVPSPKTLESEKLFEDRQADLRPFASLNDALEPFIEEEPFCLVFSVCKASPREVIDNLHVMTSIRNIIHPYITRDIAVSESQQKGGHKDQSNTNVKGTSQQEQPHLLSKVVQFVVGAKQEGGWWGAGKSAVNYQTSSTSTETTGDSWSSQQGKTSTFRMLDAGLELLDNSLKLSIEQLNQAVGTGAFYGCITVYSQNESTRMRIGRGLAGALSGSHSHVRPFQVIPYAGPKADFMLRYNLAAKDVLDGIPILNTQQASQLLMLPDAELPGLRLKRNIFYGRSTSSMRERSGQPPAVFLGSSAFLDPVVTKPSWDRIEDGMSDEERTVRVPAKDFLSHVLITGTTGSGKTVRAIQILNRLDRRSFKLVVIETAKKTFRNYLRRGGATPTVYTLGGATGHRFRINPFFFDNDTSLKRHISVLSDAFSDLLPVEALIGPKLREAILDCYFMYGWNVETGKYEGSGEPRYPTMIDFNHRVPEICRTLPYSPEINANYTGALLGRAKIFIDDLYQDIFSFDGNRGFDELFSEDSILELDDLPPSEINMPAFVVSVVLQRLRAHCSSKRKVSSTRPPLPYYVLVIEEAHNILNRKLEEAPDPRQTGGARHLLQQVVRLLQEGRDLGIGVIVIDQSPHSLADAVLKNTNTKVVHRLVDGDEIQVIGTAIALEEDEWPDLTYLDDGECIVSMKAGGKPVKLSPFSADELDQRQGPAGLDHGTTVPNYAQSQRIIDDAAKNAESFDDIDHFSNQLLQACQGHLELINFMVGKYRSWRGMFQGKDPWKPALIKEEIPALLAALDPANITPDGLFDELVLLRLDGAELQKKVDVLKHAFGPTWISEAAIRFVSDLKAFSMDFCGDNGFLDVTMHVLISYARDLQTGKGNKESSEKLSFHLKSRELLEVMVPVLVARRWKHRGPDPDIVEEILVNAEEESWAAVHSMLSKVLPRTEEAVISQLMEVCGLSQMLSSHKPLQRTEVNQLQGKLTRFGSWLRQSEGEQNG